MRRAHAHMRISFPIATRQRLDELTSELRVPLPVSAPPASDSPGYHRARAPDGAPGRVATAELVRPAAPRGPARE